MILWTYYLKKFERNKKKKKIDDYTFFEDLHIVNATITVQVAKFQELRNIRGTREISEFLCIVSRIDTNFFGRTREIPKENANIARIEKRNA